MTTAAKAPAATRWRIDQRQREAERQAEDRRRGTHLHEAMLALTPVDLSDVDLPVSYDSASDADRALYRRYVETVSNRVAAAARRYGPVSAILRRPCGRRCISSLVSVTASPESSAAPIVQATTAV